MPVLILQNDTVIDESLDIMIWATKEGNLDWFGDGKKKQMESIGVNDSDFKYWIDRYKYPDRFPENEMKFYRNKCDEHLKIYEILLSNQKYLFSDENLSLGDAAVLPFVRQFNGVDQEHMSKYPNLGRWLNNIVQSNLFISVMEKYEFWSPNQAPNVVIFSKLI